jgi:hypothetical protein
MADPCRLMDFLRWSLDRGGGAWFSGRCEAPPNRPAFLTPRYPREARSQSRDARKGGRGACLPCASRSRRRDGSRRCFGRDWGLFRDAPWTHAFAWRCLACGLVNGNALARHMKAEIERIIAGSKAPFSFRPRWPQAVAVRAPLLTPPGVQLRCGRQPMLTFGHVPSGIAVPTDCLMHLLIPRPSGWGPGDTWPTPRYVTNSGRDSSTCPHGDRTKQRPITRRPSVDGRPPGVDERVRTDLLRPIR